MTGWSVDLCFLFPQSIWKTLIGSGQPIDIEMFNYDGEYVSFNWKPLFFLTLMSNLCVMKCSCSLCGGLTPLLAAVVSHNAVVKELRSLESPCSYMAMGLAQRKQMYVECIKTLLLMGASCGTKVAMVDFIPSSFLGCRGLTLRKWPCSHSVSFSSLQDLKSGRTCLHMASQEANVELFSIFLDQPSSLSIVNAKVSCAVAVKSGWNECNAQTARAVVCDSASACFRPSVETQRCTLSALCKTIKVKWKRWSCWWEKEQTPGPGTLKMNFRLSWCPKDPLVKR